MCGLCKKRREFINFHSTIFQFMPGRLPENTLNSLRNPALRLSVFVAIIGISVAGVVQTPLAEWAA
jgi:hypothetical protein